ncbi:MAG TPA: hypothetical protein VFU69_03810 [Ktedonobacterales bacterium]|nr:hypothetical protein [Ktedonobacterales bacterium]
MVQAVIEAAEQERHLLEVLVHLPQPVQITQDGPGYTWQCAGDQDSTATLLQTVQEALTTLLGTPAAGRERLSMSVGGNARVRRRLKGRPPRMKLRSPIISYKGLFY